MDNAQTHRGIAMLDDISPAVERALEAAALSRGRAA